MCFPISPRRRLPRHRRPVFADIFRGNALKNGLLPVALGEADHAALVAAMTAGPATPITIDLERQPS